jgi:hypothetical protein
MVGVSTGIDTAAQGGAAVSSVAKGVGKFAGHAELLSDLAGAVNAGMNGAWTDALKEGVGAASGAATAWALGRFAVNLASSVNPTARAVIAGVFAGAGELAGTTAGKGIVTSLLEQPYDGYMKIEPGYYAVGGKLEYLEGWFKVSKTRSPLRFDPFDRAGPEKEAGLELQREMVTAIATAPVEADLLARLDLTRITPENIFGWRIHRGGEYGGGSTKFSAPEGFYLDQTPPGMPPGPVSQLRATGELETQLNQLAGYGERARALPGYHADLRQVLNEQMRTELGEKFGDRALPEIHGLDVANLDPNRIAGYTY